MAWPDSASFHGTAERPGRPGQTQPPAQPAQSAQPTQSAQPAPSGRRTPRRRNALLRVATGLVMTVLMGEAGYGLVEGAIGAGVIGTAIGVLCGAAAAFAAYYLVLARLMEGRRTLDELRLRGALREGVAGFGLGTALLLLTVGTIALVGGVRVASGGSVAAAIAAGFSGAVLPAVVEEIAFRGVLFRVTERSLGTWAATAISSVLFGGAHLANPNATPWSTATLVIEAGVLLSAVYVLTHRLWICIGFHFAYNLFLGVLGLPSSGQETAGLWTVRLSGPHALTGGAFGPEASVVSLLLMTGVGAAIMWYAHRRGCFVPSRRARGPADGEDWALWT